MPVGSKQPDDGGLETVVEKLLGLKDPSGQPLYSPEMVSNNVACARVVIESAKRGKLPDLPVEALTVVFIGVDFASMVPGDAAECRRLDILSLGKSVGVDIDSLSNAFEDSVVIYAWLMDLTWVQPGKLEEGVDMLTSLPEP
jgi:hypothetical protein